MILSNSLLGGGFSRDCGLFPSISMCPKVFNLLGLTVGSVPMSIIGFKFISAVALRSDAFIKSFTDLSRGMPPNCIVCSGLSAGVSDCNSFSLPLDDDPVACLGAMGVSNCALAVNCLFAGNVGTLGVSSCTESTDGTMIFPAKTSSNVSLSSSSTNILAPFCR